MVEAKYSATGHPLLVGGPQVGYFYPGLTYEIDMHAPGLDWRGATSAPFPGYMLIGRGADFATTLTSAVRRRRSSSPRRCAATAGRSTCSRASA